MARPNYTVVVHLNGTVEVQQVATVPMDCKGTSEYKANKILEEISN